MDHLQLRVDPSIIPGMAQTYATILAPLGVNEVMRFSGPLSGGKLAVGFGKEKKPVFWLLELKVETDAVSGPLHIASVAENRQQVDAFHEAGLKAGLQSNGKPGLRTEYHANYYGAFVIDETGNNVEAVCHVSETEAA